MKRTIVFLSLFLLAGIPQALTASGPRTRQQASTVTYFRQKSGLYFERQWGKWGRSKSGLYMANNLKVHPGGEVYITSSPGGGDDRDFSYHRAQRFTPLGEYLGWFGGWKNGTQKPEWICMPNSVSFAPNGWVHLLASFGGTVKTYTPAGEVKGSFSGFGGGGGPTTFPYALCADKDGAVFVSLSSTMHGLINKFDASGNVLLVITDDTMGKGNEFLKGPRGLASDRFGNLYACDGGRNRVAKLDAGARYLGEIKAGTGMINPDEPAASPDGGLYVLASHRVFRFDPRGKLVSVFGGQGAGNNQFRYAWSVACAWDGRVFVLDSDSSARIASVKVLRPAYYSHKYSKVKLGGRVIGTAAADLKLVTLVVEGRDGSGVDFFAAARPAADGRYLFTGFPKGATFRLSVRGVNTFVYQEPADITGKATKNATNLDFTAVKK